MNEVLWRTCVTRFGEIWPLWLNFKSIWHFLKLNVLFGQILNILKILNGFGQIVIAVNGQILNK